MNSDTGSNSEDEWNKSLELLEEKCRGITLRKLPDLAAQISCPFGKPEDVRIALDPPAIDAVLAPTEKQGAPFALNLLVRLIASPHRLR